MQPKLVKVKNKTTGKEFFVNAEDYETAAVTDAEGEETPLKDVCDKVVERVRAEKEPKAHKEKQEHNSTHTRAELSVMSADELKKLPEWKRVKDAEKLTTKEAMVEAIIQARQHS